MANDIKEIGEIVKKCKILLLDIEGTTTSISFVKDKLFPYAEENVKKFLDSQWETDDVKEVVAALRKLALEDQEKSVDGVVGIPGEDASKEDQIEGLVNNVKWQMSSDRKEGALKQLQGLIWKQGYDSGDIKGHVYDDVSSALEQWRSVDGQKVYIYSSGSVQAQKLLFAQSLAGDLLRFIDGHFDTAVGAKQEAASYTAIAEKIGVQPADVLFLTDIPKEGEAARVAGFHVALVSREGNAPLSTEATDAFVVLHSLAQLTASNKRKTEPQDEQPAKVPKTDTDIDVKTASESVAVEEKALEKIVQDEQEKMEVEECPLVQDVKEIEKKVDEIVNNTKTLIEDVTDTIESLDIPMIDTEPVITEVDEEKSDTNKTEMDTEVAETIKSVEVDTKPDEVTNKPEESATSNEIVTKPDEVTITPNEIVAKSEEAVTKPAEVAPISDEIVNKSDEVLAKADEVVTKTSEVSESTQASSPVETQDNLLESKANDNEAKLIDDSQKEEPMTSKDEIETQVVKEKAKVAEETPPTMDTEIEEITAENLGDVAEMIEDLEPIVEEPTNEDMEDLQNVGEVLEKECDEILSKVQDVTNLDSIPLKPLLNPIIEESMETEIDAENMDSNDIVERILDSEIELEMKQCNDIDLNTISEITDDAKIEETVEIQLTVQNQNESETNAKLEDKNTENNKEVSSVPGNMDMESSQSECKADNDMINNETMESNENKENNGIKENNEAIKINEKVNNGDKNESNEKLESNDEVVCSENVEIKEKLDKKEVQDNEQNENKMDTTDKIESKEQEDSVKLDATDKMDTNNKVEDTQVPDIEESKAQSSENNKDIGTTQAESTDTEMVSEEVKTEIVSGDATTDSEKDKETQVNGKTTNGEPEAVNVNGDATKTEELNSRLSVENGKETVNGSNGDSVDSEKGQGDKGEADVSDIKVKTVATEEPPTDPIEQPAEA